MSAIFPGARSAAPYDPRMPWRAVGLVLTWVAVFVALVLFWPVVSLALDEGAVPSPSDAPIPAGVTVTHDELRCGSGGCYHVLRLTVPRDQSPEDVAASLGMPDEKCRPSSLLDRRRVCSSATFNERTVVLHLRYDRSFYL
jgi:hypothetical protein